MAEIQKSVMENAKEQNLDTTALRALKEWDESRTATVANKLASIPLMSQLGSFPSQISVSTDFMSPANAQCMADQGLYEGGAVLTPSQETDSIQKADKKPAPPKVDRHFAENRHSQIRKPKETKSTISSPSSNPVAADAAKLVQAEASMPKPSPIEAAKSKIAETQASVDAAKTAVDTAKSELQKARIIAGEKGVTPETQQGIEKAKNTYDKAVATLEQTQTNLKSLQMVENYIKALETKASISKSLTEANGNLPTLQASVNTTKTALENAKAKVKQETQKSCGPDFDKAVQAEERAHEKAVASLDAAKVTIAKAGFQLRSTELAIARIEKNPNQSVKTMIASINEGSKKLA